MFALAVAAFAVAAAADPPKSGLLAEIAAPGALSRCCCCCCCCWRRRRLCGENDSSRSAVGSEERSSSPLPLLFPASLSALAARAEAGLGVAWEAEAGSSPLALLSAAASASALTAAASRCRAASSSLPASRSITSKKRSAADAVAVSPCSELRGAREGEEAPKAATAAGAASFSSLLPLPTSLLLHAPRTPPARLALLGFTIASASPTITASATLPAVAATPCSITSNVVVTALFKKVLTGEGSSRKTVSSSLRAKEPASTPGTSVTRIECVSAPRGVVVRCLIRRETASVQ